MTGLIGKRCTHGNVFSLLVLIGRSCGEQRKSRISNAAGPLTPGEILVVRISLDYPLRVTTYRLVEYIDNLIVWARTALGFSSLSSDVVPPDPIPNSEVKRVSGDNTCFARNREDNSRLGDREAVFLWDALPQLCGWCPCSVR